MTIDQLMGSLQTHEQRLQKRTQNSLEHALKTKGQRGCGNGMRGHGRGNFNYGGVRDQNHAQAQRGQGRGKFSRPYNHSRYEKSMIQRYNCKKYGHYSSKCRYRSQNDVFEIANFVEKKNGEEEPTLLLAYKDKNDNQINTCYLDPRASNHMCGRKELFVELNKLSHGHVTFGDSSKRPLKGKGKILIKMKNGGHQFISDLYYVPDMKNNILSVGKLLENGYNIFMKNGSLYLRDQINNLIAKVIMTKNRMFPINIKSEDVNASNLF
ncbi:hypothetical protein AMTRI_Chr13g89770 [Amborella trichopoda]